MRETYGRQGLPSPKMRAMIHAIYDARELSSSRATISWAPPPYYASNGTRELWCARPVAPASYESLASPPHQFANNDAREP